MEETQMMDPINFRKPSLMMLTENTSQRVQKEKRDFIVSALKLEKNQLLDKRKVVVVVKLMMKHWRILDSTPSSMRIGKISGIKLKVLLKQDAGLSHEKPRPLNLIIREEVEKTLRKW